MEQWCAFGGRHTQQRTQYERFSSPSTRFPRPVRDSPASIRIDTAFGTGRHVTSERRTMPGSVNCIMISPIIATVVCVHASVTKIMSAVLYEPKPARRCNNPTPIMAAPNTITTLLRRWCRRSGRGSGSGGSVGSLDMRETADVGVVARGGRTNTPAPVLSVTPETRSVGTSSSRWHHLSR